MCGVQLAKQHFCAAIIPIQCSMQLQQQRILSRHLIKHQSARALICSPCHPARLAG